MNNSTLAVTFVAVCAVGYLLYFDQKRKNPSFRNKIRKEYETVKKLQEKYKKNILSEEDETTKTIIQMLEAEDSKPVTEEEKQRFITKQLQLGEQFLNQGPAMYGVAAHCLFKAMQEFPEPLKLKKAFEETVPKGVLDKLSILLDKEKSRFQEVE